MNYNDYDDKGRKKSFDYSLLFTDKKYRSRMVLLLYVVFFAILIIGVRSSIQNKGSENSVTNQQLEPGKDEQSGKQEEENPTEFDELSQSLSYILTNNYNFQYTLYYNEEEFIAEGKRFANKLEFDLSREESTIHYLVNGSLIKAKALGTEEAKYQSAILPYYYVNYFDPEIIKEVLQNATQIEENTYEISNGKLYQFLSNVTIENIWEPESTNIIKVKKQNNSITELEWDLTNLALSLEQEPIQSVKIVQKYSNFNLIDNFTINFE